MADLLTPQLRRILLRIAEGKTEKEIGSELFISQSTVRTHKRKIFDKLKVDCAAAAVHKAWQLGIFGQGKEIGD